MNWQCLVWLLLEAGAASFEIWSAVWVKANCSSHRHTCTRAHKQTHTHTHRQTMQLDRLHVEGNIPPLNNVVLLKHLQLICRHGAGASKSPVLLSTTASADHAKASERKANERKANERKANERKENTPSPSNQTKQTRQVGCGWRKMKMESRYDIQNCTDGSVVHFFRLASHFKANRNMARFFKPFPSGFFEFFRQARHQDNLRAIFCGSLNACCCCCCCCVCVCVGERTKARPFFFPFSFCPFVGGFPSASFSLCASALHSPVFCLVFLVSCRPSTVIFTSTLSPPFSRTLTHHTLTHHNVCHQARYAELS